MYQPAIKDVAHRRRHVDILTHDVVRADSCYLVLCALSLTPVLLSYNPDPAMVMLGIILRRVMSDHEFQPLHRPQSTLKCFPSLDNVEHVGIMERLCGQGGVVGGSIEEGGLGEVRQDWGELQGAGQAWIRFGSDLPVLVWMPPIS